MEVLDLFCCRPSAYPQGELKPQLQYKTILLSYVLLVSMHRSVRCFFQISRLVHAAYASMATMINRSRLPLDILPGNAPPWCLTSKHLARYPPFSPISICLVSIERSVRGTAFPIMPRLPPLCSPITRQTRGPCLFNSFPLLQLPSKGPDITTPPMTSVVPRQENRRTSVLGFLHNTELNIDFC